MSDAPAKPATIPSNPSFSSGPCAKRPGWTLEALKDACVGRSHRSKAGKAKLQEVIDRSRAVLGVPEDYRIAIVAGSDTGAVEMALWNLLGPRPVDVMAWEAFSQDWVTDVVKQLKIKNARTFTADYGKLPGLTNVDFDHDVVFAWNGTTSGVRVPNGDWIAADRKGLTICDATSAVFAMEMPWDKLDVVTYSWQKVMGGEAAHGMLILGPRAVERLESYTPEWPLPKTFRMVKNGKLEEGIFNGETINTPSLLCVEDAIDGLKWAEQAGGVPALVARSEANLRIITEWVEKTPWIEFLCQEPTHRSCTSICLKIVDPWFESLDDKTRAEAAKKLVGMLENNKAAYDVGSYRAAPPGLRIWGGATVEASDIQALLPWLDWAYARLPQALEQAKAA
jgi:phosphoserine aminotransferase